jgi:hypothetical protein
MGTSPPQWPEHFWTGRHRNYFKFEDGDLLEELEEGAPRGILPHALLLVAIWCQSAYLAEQLALPVDYVIETMGAPDAAGVVAIAIVAVAIDRSAEPRAASLRRSAAPISEVGHCPVVRSWIFLTAGALALHPDAAGAISNKGGRSVP